MTLMDWLGRKTSTQKKKKKLSDLSEYLNEIQNYIKTKIYFFDTVRLHFHFDINNKLIWEIQIWARAWQNLQ